MTSTETYYHKGLDGSYSQNRRQGLEEIKKNRGNKVAIGTIHSISPPHSSTFPSPFKNYC